MLILFSYPVFLGLSPHLPSQPHHHERFNSFTVQTCFLYSSHALDVLLLNRISWHMGNMDIRQRMAQLCPSREILGRQH